MTTMPGGPRPRCCKTRFSAALGYGRCLVAGFASVLLSEALKRAMCDSSRSCTPACMLTRWICSTCCNQMQQDFHSVLRCISLHSENIALWTEVEQRHSELLSCSWFECCRFDEARFRFRVFELYADMLTQSALIGMQEGFVPGCSRCEKQIHTERYAV